MTSSDDGRFWKFLARRFPWLGTPGVLKAVVLLNALTFLLITAAPSYADRLALEPALILRGEVWRLVSYIFVPEWRSPLWVIFGLLFLWFLSSALEETWGSLRLNVFYLTGMVGCTVAAFFTGIGTPSNTFLNLSLFFAFATVAPNYEVFLFFVARVKIKYLALFLAAVFAIQFLALPAPAKLAMTASLANYLIFFVPPFLRARWTGRHDAKRLQQFRAATRELATLHRCTSCGRTEVSAPEVEFRVTETGEEYCLEHLPSR